MVLSQKYTRKQISSPGFTIVEMLVSLALFTIVITIATGAFLSLIGGNSQLQGEQKVMTSLAFALDSMTREIRTGRHYFCDPNAGATSDLNDLLANSDCPNGEVAMSFVESGTSLSGGGTSGRIAYVYHSTGNNGNGSIGRSVKGQSLEDITSSDVKIKSAKFLVSGAEPRSGGSDVTQPTVTIVIEAQDPDDTSKTYTIETTVTQRELDI